MIGRPAHLLFYRASDVLVGIFLAAVSAAGGFGTYNEASNETDLEANSSKTPHLCTHVPVPPGYQFTVVTRLLVQGLSTVARF